MKNTPTKQIDDLVIKYKLSDEYTLSELIYDIKTILKSVELSAYGDIPNTIMEFFTRAKNLYNEGSEITEESMMYEKEIHIEYMYQLFSLMWDMTIYYESQLQEKK